MTIANAIPFASRTCDSYGRTDGRTNEDSTYPPLKSFTSVTRTRAYRVIAGFQQSAALRASLNHGGHP